LQQTPYGFLDKCTRPVCQLERYAAGTAGKTLRPDGKVTVQFYAASLNLLQCSKALLWHAVQAALGNAKSLAHGAPKPVTEAATRRAFEKLVRKSRYMHVSWPPDVERHFDRRDRRYDAAVVKKLDGTVSEGEFMIARHLLFEGHALKAVVAAMLDFGPALAQRKGKRAAAYTAQTLARAAADKDLEKWTAERAAAQKNAQALADSGSDWLQFWRRSVAYAYWACRMTKHSGGLHSWILNIGNTAACCLALGWTDRAVRVREILGLPNPVLDHPLMTTALGTLPPASKPYSDKLLDGMVAQAREEFAEL
jgi:hypothetical protein